MFEISTTVFEVIVSTISTGRVARHAFDSYAKAQKCATRHDGARSRGGNRIYRVELVRRDVPAARPALAEAA